MKTRYRNPWYKPADGTRLNPYNTEFFEADGDSGIIGPYKIYERNEYGYPIFDIVKDGVCVGQRNGLGGAFAHARELGKS